LPSDGLFGCRIKTATNFHYYFAEFNPQIQEAKPILTICPPPAAAGRKTRRLASKKFPPLKPLYFLPARQGNLKINKSMLLSIYRGNFILSSMQIQKIYIGGWFQRTTLHLTEIWDFLKYGKSNLDFPQKKLIEARNILSIVEVSRESGPLEYIYMPKLI